MSDLKVKATSVEVNQKVLEERIIEDIREADMDTLKAVFEFMYPVKVEDVEGMEGEEVIVTTTEDADGMTLDEIF
jgi:hypothetical protein